MKVFSLFIKGWQLVRLNADVDPKCQSRDQTHTMWWQWILAFEPEITYTSPAVPGPTCMLRLLTDFYSTQQMLHLLFVHFGDSLTLVNAGQYHYEMLVMNRHFSWDDICSNICKEKYEIEEVQILYNFFMFNRSFVTCCITLTYWTMQHPIWMYVPSFSVYDEKLTSKKNTNCINIS